MQVECCGTCDKLMIKKCILDHIAEVGKMVRRESMKKDTKMNEYVVWFDNYDCIKISIKEDIDRPNYTDDYQLIVDYVERIYGTQVYEIMELDALEKVEL